MMRIGRQWDERLKMWDEAFERNLYIQLGEVELMGFTTMEQMTLEQAKRQCFRPFPRGTGWGEKWEYGWFMSSVKIPDSAVGKRVLLRLGAGPEMLVYVNGVEAGSIDSRHAMVELTDCAAFGEIFEICAECYAGHGVRPECGGIYEREDVPVPEPEACQCVVGSSHFGIQDQEMFAAYADYHTLYELWKALPEGDLRAMQIGQALQQFTCIVDFEAPQPRRSESVREGKRVLAPLLEKRNGDTAPDFTIFGQSHLDLAWLWPQAETRRKAARTYSNQLALMERYPDYRFLLCSPTVLEYLKQYYPKLFQRVKEKAATGQFVPEGAVYVESDTNLPGGESLIRQFVLGKRWFRKEFGTDSKVAWLPDTFGFSGALPQIMKGCGVSWFATQKLLRCDPECEQFPYNLFWWEGIDGTRILSHLFKKNNAVFTSGALRERWEKDRNQRQDIDVFMFPFGYGDGGGGPTELMVETAMRCKDLEGAPRCRMESPAAFFERLDQGKIENVYYGELYLAWHRGTYTAQARIKRGVRKAEYALREAEYLAGLLRLAGNTEGEKEILHKLEELWELLLFQEFHDILPGTSIERVNREAEHALEQVEQESRRLAGELLDRLAGGRAVFNSLSWERNYRGIELPPCGYVRLRDPAVPGDENCGEQTRECTVGDEDCGEQTRECAAGDENCGEQTRECAVGDENCGEQTRECAAGDEDCEEQTRECVPGEGSSGRSAVECAAQGGEYAFNNVFISACVDRQGRITSLKDRISGYEYVEKPLNQWRLYRDVNVDYDAWELGRMYEQVPEKLEGNCTFQVERMPDGSATVVVERREEHFTAIQKIHFSWDSPRIDFETEIDWQERHRLLKVDFPTTVYTKEVLQEIQFGYIRRPTHRSRQYEKDLYETCHHKYAVLTDGENGFAVLNDCKYGLSAQDSRLSLTLLRAPVIPDMTADLGIQRFTYSILPFSGPFVRSRVTEEAYEQNVDVTVSVENSLERNVPFESVSFFRLEGGHTVLETCKPAFDREQGVVLRIYEAKGCGGETTLSVPVSVRRAYACNMLEEAQQELELKEGRIRLRFHAFEIKTIMLELY